MSELRKLKRLVNSWMGSMRKARREAEYKEDDPRMIINELGLQLSPEGLKFIADDSFRREDMLMQIYAAEEELDVDLVKANVMLDPIWEPKVYEEKNRIAITVVVDRDEVIIIEFSTDPESSVPMP